LCVATNNINKLYRLMRQIIIDFYHVKLYFLITVESVIFFLNNIIFIIIHLIFNLIDYL